MIDEREVRQGSEEGRALLRMAPPPVVPEALRGAVRRAIEARLSARGRRSAARRLVLAVTMSLLAGSALAYGLSQLRTRVRQPSAPRPLTAGPRRAPGPRLVPLETPRFTPPPRPPRVRHPARAMAALSPEHAGPPSQWPSSEPEDDGPVPAPPRLVIHRQGRPDVSLVLAGDRVVGQVAGAPVSLTLSGAQLLGKLGDRNVWLWLHGHDAEGYIGGAPVRFELADTNRGQELREGFVLHGALPAQATRLVAADGALSWSPGCGASLASDGEGGYAGHCRRGDQARVTVPRSWQRLSPLPRLILLSFFLTERDPRFEPLFP